MNSKYYLLFNLEIRVSLIFYIISEKFFQLLFFENILIKKFGKMSQLILKFMFENNIF